MSHDHRLSEEEFNRLEENGKEQHKLKIQALMANINSSGKTSCRTQITKLHGKMEALDTADGSVRLAKMKAIAESLSEVTNEYNDHKENWKNVMDTNLFDEDWFNDENVKMDDYDMKVAEMRNVYHQLTTDQTHKEEC